MLYKTMSLCPRTMSNRDIRKYKEESKCPIEILQIDPPSKNKTITQINDKKEVITNNEEGKRGKK